MRIALRASWVLGLATVIGGCGLIIDLQPADDDNGIDASLRDASSADAGDPMDANANDDAAVLDAGNPDDAALPDAGRPEAGRGDASVSCRRTPCDVVRQCGCMSGQVCRLDDSGLALCASPGGNPAGSACLTDENCGPGLACLRPDGVEATTPGVCTPACIDDSDCSAPGDTCLRRLIGGVAQPFGTCGVPCDPVMNIGCPSGAACDIALITLGGSPTLITYCRRPGPGMDGDTCGRAVECEYLLHCAGGTCQRLCTPPSGGGVPPGCLMGMTCDVAMDPTGTYGICNGG